MPTPAKAGGRQSRDQTSAPTSLRSSRAASVHTGCQHQRRLGDTSRGTGPRRQGRGSTRAPTLFAHGPVRRRPGSPRTEARSGLGASLPPFVPSGVRARQMPTPAKAGGRQSRDLASAPTSPPFVPSGVRAHQMPTPAKAGGRQSRDQTSAPQPWFDSGPVTFRPRPGSATARLTTNESERPILGTQAPRQCSARSAVSLAGATSRKARTGLETRYHFSARSTPGDELRWVSTPPSRRSFRGRPRGTGCLI